MQALTDEDRAEALVFWADAALAASTLFGSALVTQPGHTLLRVRAFRYVSGGLGFGGGGAGCARERRAGKHECRDAEDEKTKPKCHWGHYHLLPGKSLLPLRVSVRRPVNLQEFESKNRLMRNLIFRW